MSVLLIKLTDGSNVTLDEFVTWSAQKQAARLMPIENREKNTKVIRRTYRAVTTPLGEFPSINAAARALNTTTTKLGRLIFDLDNDSYKFSKELDKDIPKYFRSSDVIVGRKVITPSGVFKTVTEASKSLNITGASLKRLIYDTTNDGFKFVVELERDKNKSFDGNVRKKERYFKTARAVITPKGRFESLSVASESYGIGVDVLRRYVFNTAYPEFKYETEQPNDKQKYFNKVISKSFHKPTVFIKTPLGLFKSIGEAATAHNMPRHQMERKSLSDKYPEFERVEQEYGEYDHVKSKTKKKTVTPLGTFNSKIEAIKAHKISRDEFSKLMRLQPKKYYFLNE